MFANAYQAYQKSNILTSDPKRLVLLCYDEAIGSLARAGEAMRKRDYEAKGKELERSLDILNHLRENLNFEKGGEIAGQLDRLYGFMIGHLIRSDLKKNEAGFGDVAEMLRQLKGSWEAALFPPADNHFPLNNLSARGKSPEFNQDRR